MAQESVVLTDRFTQATNYAVAIHAPQFRKGTSVPYVAHLLGVASLVLEAGGDEDLTIAGLLHDAVEDCGGIPRLEGIRKRFGDRVAAVVLGRSDATDSHAKKGQGYWERKQNYLNHLRSAEPDVLLVSLADKVHNARSIVTDIESHGVGVLSKFNGTPEQVFRYYRACLEIGIESGAPATLTAPLANSVEDITQALEVGKEPH